MINPSYLFTAPLLLANVVVTEVFDSAVHQWYVGYEKQDFLGSHNTYTVKKIDHSLKHVKTNLRFFDFS